MCLPNSKAGVPGMKPSLRLAVWDRDNGQCQNIIDGQKCLKPASEPHHIIPKGMGGRHGKAKVESESLDNYESRCLQCHHTILLEGKRYMGHG